MLLHKVRAIVASAASTFIVLGGATPTLAAPIKNIVLVHGAWVDGSGWKPVYEILERMPSATQKEEGAIQKTADGFTFLDPADFYRDFAADLPREQAEFDSKHG